MPQMPDVAKMQRFRRQNAYFPSYMLYKKRVNMGVELSLKLKVKIFSVYQRIKVDKGFFKMREFLFIYLLKNV